MKNCLKQKEEHIQLPPRTLLFKEKPFSVFGTMPVLDSGANLYVVKNAALVTGEHTGKVSALTSVFDTTSGDPIALIEGTSMTGYRTAAVSAAITDHCVVSDASTIGIIGAGVQAWYHTLAMVAIRPVREIRIFSRGYKRLNDFVTRLKTLKKHMNVTICETSEMCVKNADIIVTATTSRTPVVSTENIKKNAHVCIIGSHSKSSREVSHNELFRHLVIVENVAEAVAEAGEKHKHAITPQQLFYMDHKELSSQKTFFSSIGTALQDLYFVKYLLSKPADKEQTINLYNE